MSNEAEKTPASTPPTPESAPATASSTEATASAAALAPTSAAIEGAGGGLLDRLSPILDHSPETRDFLEKNGRSMLIGVTAAALVFVGSSAYRNYRASQAKEAEGQLFAAQTTEGLQSVVDDYGSTPVAPLARLALASAQYEAGQYEVAEKLYGQFVEKHPQHALRDQAEFNRAVCREAAGRLEDALAAYTAFAGKGKEHFLYPETVFGRARCLEQMGKFGEAKAVYEDFVAASPTNAWADRAHAAMLYADKEQRASLLPKPAAPALAPLSLGLPQAAPLPTPTPAPVPAPAPSPAPAPAAPPAAKP